ncbi:MAG: DegV family protein, partial [Clostridiales bacterium]|nr:DegV family protein [Clostridiales bacterium]
DSASDLSVQNERELGIKIMNFKLTVGDKSYISRVDVNNEKFYSLLEGYNGIPTTSQITAFEYEEEFEKYYKKGYSDVINVTINGNGSATYNNSIMAAETFFENHPEAKDKFNIYNIDGESYTGGYGYAVVQAAAKIKKGASAKEAVEFIKDWISKAVIFFAPYTLKYAKKSGRIPSAAAFVGEVLGLKPIMRICEGEIKTNDKVRGDKAVVPKIEAKVMEEMIPQTPYCIVYGSDDKVRDEMAQAMTKRLGYPPVEFYQIGAAIAINAGPKVTGVIFKSKNR